MKPKPNYFAIGLSVLVVVLAIVALFFAFKIWQRKTTPESEKKPSSVTYKKVVQLPIKQSALVPATPTATTISPSPTSGPVEITPPETSSAVISLTPTKSIVLVTPAASITQSTPVEDEEAELPRSGIIEATGTIMTIALSLIILAFLF